MEGENHAEEEHSSQKKTGSAKALKHGISVYKEKQEGQCASQE